MEEEAGHLLPPGLVAAGLPGVRLPHQEEVALENCLDCLDDSPDFPTDGLCRTSTFCLQGRVFRSSYQ